MIETTPRHFEIFKQECQRWIKKLELSQWEVHYYHADMSVAGNLQAELSGYIATISLCQQWDDIVTPLTNSNVKRIAKHEVFHLFLARLYCKASNRFASELELSAAEHEVVRKLEKLLR